VKLESKTFRISGREHGSCNNTVENAINNRSTHVINLISLKPKWFYMLVIGC